MNFQLLTKIRFYFVKATTNALIWVSENSIEMSLSLIVCGRKRLHLCLQRLRRQRVESQTAAIQLWLRRCVCVVFSIRDGYLILNLCKSACRRSHQLKKVAKFVAPSVVYENRSCCCAAHGVQSAFSQINSSPPPLELGAQAQAPTHLLLLQHTRINKFKWCMNRTANFSNLFFSPAPPRRVAFATKYIKRTKRQRIN